MSFGQLVKDWDPLLEKLVPDLGPLQRAGLWGQVPQESNSKPDAEEFPGLAKGGKGLWQHTGDRLKNVTETEGNPLGLFGFANRQGKSWKDIGTQVRFVAYELHNLPAGIHTREQLKKVTSPEAAAGTAMAYFESPKDWEKEIDHPGTTTANLPRRIDGTYKALAVIQAAQPGAKPVTDPQTPVVSSNTESDLAHWIKENKIPAEAVIRGLLVGKGIPGFVVDLIFNVLNPLIDQLATQFKPEDVGNLLVDHVIKPIIANMTKKHSS